MKLSALALLLTAAARAADPAGSCAAPEARQFNFWIGEWDVQVNGIVVARSSIQSIASGCIILENWMPFGAGEGKSLRATILTCLAFTWLNPHVYLDTVVLLG